MTAAKQSCKLCYYPEQLQLHILHWILEIKAYDPVLRAVFFPFCHKEAGELG